MSNDKRILILSLGRRGGSVRYGSSIIESMGSVPRTIFVSRYSKEWCPSGAYAIPTYRSKREFIFASCIVLPFFWLYILGGLFRGSYSSLYTPYTHYWNTLFIWTFRLFGKRTISTVHDGIPHAGDGNWWEKIINNYVLHHSDHLIFLTQHVRTFLKEKIGFTASSSVIPHGQILIEGVIPKKRKAPERASLLFLGRVCHYKGVDILLDALKYIPTEKIKEIVIAGEVVSDQQLLKSFTSPVPIRWEDRWLDEIEMAEELNRSDILILPYREATQSGVMTIGISSGTPMVSTNVGGLVEQCDQLECHFVLPTPESLGTGITNLLSSTQLYEELQVHMENKRKSLNWNSIASEILTCINHA